MDIHPLHSDGASATISARGAELQALSLAGLPLLWEAGPLWPRHAPLLFPVVGAVRNDRITCGGRSHPMPKHGFARDRDFAWVERTAATCTLELQDDEATRDAYPFPFRLRVAYTLGPRGLRMDLALRNPGEAALPASLGLHPAFRWPLAPGAPKHAHRLVFDGDEPGALRRIDAEGLVLPALLPTPIRDRTLPLHEDLFREDALLFLEPASQGLRLETGGGPSLRLTWEGFSHLGVWTKPDPGPAFICIEPWSGHADPSDWQGDFSQKPGSFEVPPGGTRRWSFTAELEA